MKPTEVQNACVYAFAEALLERMVHDPEIDLWVLPEGACITAPKSMVHTAKTAIELNKKTFKV